MSQGDTPSEYPDVLAELERLFEYREPVDPALIDRLTTRAIASARTGQTRAVGRGEAVALSGACWVAMQVALLSSGTASGTVWEVVGAAGAALVLVAFGRAAADDPSWSDKEPAILSTEVSGE